MDRETNGPPDAQSGRATALIEGARRGDASAIDELIGLVYPELKRRARWLMMESGPATPSAPVARNWCRG